jgi:Family of unknown function (DUF5652)
MSNIIWIWPLIVIFAIVELILKGYTLWLSARKGQKVWFVFLLIVNSIGILPIIYILLNPPKSKKKK